MDNAHTDTTGNILVIGATGKTGSRVAARLRDLGATVKPASRSSDTYFDWTDPDSWVEALDGRNARVTNGVEQVLGRPARDFADYARHAAATGAWDLPAAATV